jgi:hypothetical protein
MANVKSGNHYNAGAALLGAEITKINYRDSADTVNCAQAFRLEDRTFDNSGRGI